MQKLLKKLIRNKIIYFKMFNCKAFSLFKKINALKKIKKLKSRAFIKYLIKYNFINIVKNDSQIDLIIYLTSIDD